LPRSDPVKEGSDYISSAASRLKAAGQSQGSAVLPSDCAPEDGSDDAAPAHGVNGQLDDGGGRPARGECRSLD
jgi:hypothetical protein